MDFGVVWLKENFDGKLFVGDPQGPITEVNYSLQVFYDRILHNDFKRRALSHLKFNFDIDFFKGDRDRRTQSAYQGAKASGDGRAPISLFGNDCQFFQKFRIRNVGDGPRVHHRGIVGFVYFYLRKSVAEFVLR